MPTTFESGVAARHVYGRIEPPLNGYTSHGVRFKVKRSSHGFRASGARPAKPSYAGNANAEVSRQKTVRCFKLVGPAVLQILGSDP